MNAIKLLTLTATLLAAPLSAETVNFDTAPPGRPPENWRPTVTGEGLALWSVVPDDTAPTKPNVLKQSGKGTYPICLKDDTSVQDGFVEVKFKAVAGKEDQAGGVIWRAKDPDNYYICRANALEDNVRIYHFVKGKRTQFKGANLTVKPGEWHTLRVEFSGGAFKVIFDGKHLFDAEDGTFKDAGKVGVWTKADSVTLFDDFQFGGK